MSKLLPIFLFTMTFAGCNQQDPLSPCLSRGYDLEQCRTAYSVYGQHDPGHWMDGIPSFVAGMGAMALINSMHSQPRYNTPAYNSYWNDYNRDPVGYTNRYAPPVSRYQSKTVINNTTIYNGTKAMESPTKQATPPTTGASSNGKPQALFSPSTVAPNRIAPSVSSSSSTPVFGTNRAVSKPSFSSPSRPSFGTNRAGKR